MGELAKIVRWAAPGAVLALVLLGTFSALKTAALFMGIYLSGSDAIVSPIAWPEFSVAAVAAGAVPAGFLVYQFYFHRQNNASRIADFVHLDIGRQILLSTANHRDLVSECTGDCHFDHGPRYAREHRRPLRALEQPPSRLPLRWVAFVALLALRKMEVELLQPASSATWTPRQKRAAMRCYYWHRARNWVTLQGVVYVREEGEKNKKLVSEADRLSEVYHTLGAAREATFAAAGLGVLAFWTWLWAWSRTSENPRPWRIFSGVQSWDKGALVLAVLLVVFSVVLLVLAGWCGRVLHGNRRDALARQATLLLRIIALADAGTSDANGRADVSSADRVQPLLHLATKSGGRAPQPLHHDVASETTVNGDPPGASATPAGTPEVVTRSG